VNVDFYTETEAELAMWLKMLRGTVILGDFAQDFELLDEIDSGSEAKIYRARERATQNEVVVKRIDKSNLWKHEHGVDQIINSMKFHRNLRHPRILSLDYVYEDATDIYMVMEYVRGGNLRERI
jgi:serine/threonine protein kinase